MIAKIRGNKKYLVPSDSGEFKSHNKNTIGEEHNEKPPHIIHFPRKKLRALSLVSATLEIERYLKMDGRVDGGEI